jgi:hypothetical protein
VWDAWRMRGETWEGIVYHMEGEYNECLTKGTNVRIFNLKTKDLNNKQ